MYKYVQHLCPGDILVSNNNNLIFVAAVRQYEEFEADQKVEVYCVTPHGVVKRLVFSYGSEFIVAIPFTFGV